MKCRLCAMINDQDWHSSVRTRYKILDNEAQREDERIATWYMTPWINIQRHLHSERNLLIGFCFTEILPVVFGRHTFHAFLLSPHIGELKKLRRQLQGKRLIKTELCVKLNLLRLFHVDHVVQNRRSALSLACHEWFSCKGKEGKIYCCELPLSSKPQI